MKFQKETTARRICAGLFGLYVLIMLYLLFFQRQAFPGDYWTYVRWSCNFIPFHTIREQLAAVGQGGYLGRFALKNLLGNVVLFIPLGLLLPALWQRQRRFRLFFATVCGSIILVELLQLFTTLGSLDVDDLILNVLGASIGFWIFKICTNPRVLS